MKVAESLKRFRKNAKLTQEEVANVLGIKRPAYSRYETGQFVPRADDIVTLAQTYDVSTDYLLGLSEIPRSNFYDEREVKEAFAARDELRQLRSILVPMINSKQSEATGATAQ